MGSFMLEENYNSYGGILLLRVKQLSCMSQVRVVGCPYKTGPDSVAKSIVIGKSTSSGVNQGLM